MPRSYLVVHLSKSKEAIQPEKSATSIINRSTGVARSTSGKSLRTPIRRFFNLEALKPSLNGIGNKRSRSEDHHPDIGTTPNQFANTPPLSSDIATSPITELDTPDADQRDQRVRPVDQQHYTPPVPCMALQNSDHSIDAVVISTLLKLPFCCHEDLLTMSPARIVEVAQEMNERLPDALQIDLSQARGHNHIRRDVEVLVGIIKSTSKITVPGAPLKRVKSRGRRDSGHVADLDFMGDIDLRAISPPTSPLAIISATRRRRAGQANIAAISSYTKLAMLREEDETEWEVGETDVKSQLDDAATDTDEDVFRAAKKRRTSGSFPENFEMITPTMRRIKAPLKLQKLYNDISTSPIYHRHLTASSRRQFALEEDSTIATDKPSNVIVKTTVIDKSLAHTRARYRSSFKFSKVQNPSQMDQTQGPLQTSTPKIAQYSHESRPLRDDNFSPLAAPPKFGYIEEAEVKTTLLHWNHVESRIPRYRRVQFAAKSSLFGVGDFMIVDRRSGKDIDAMNQTF